MARPFSSLTRSHLATDYSIDYRRSRSLRWTQQTGANYGVVIVSSGVVAYESNATQGELHERQSLILEPNVTLELRGKEVEVLFLTLSASLLIPHAIAMGLIPPQSTVSFAAEATVFKEKLQSLIGELLDELIQADAGSEIVMQALIQQIVVRLLRDFATVRHSPDLELSRVGMLDRRIRRSVELMHAQPDQDLSLRDLARASYLSPFHFSRLFKKLTGVTPHNYLAQIRVMHAKQLLANPKLSITEIGARVGYLSASHFSKAFRQATGTTPREFRSSLIVKRN